MLLQRVRSHLGGPVRRVLMWPVKARIVSGYLSPDLRRGLRWVFRDTETSNFYYQLTELNRQQLDPCQLMVGVGLKQ